MKSQIYPYKVLCFSFHHDLLFITLTSHCSWEVRIYRRNPWQRRKLLKKKAQTQKPTWLHQCHNHVHKANLPNPLLLSLPIPTKESSSISFQLTPTPPTSKSALLLDNFDPISLRYITYQNILYVNIFMHLCHAV